MQYLVIGWLTREEGFGPTDEVDIFQTSFEITNHIKPIFDLEFLSIETHLITKNNKSFLSFFLSFFDDRYDTGACIHILWVKTSHNVTFCQMFYLCVIYLKLFKSLFQNLCIYVCLSVCLRITTKSESSKDLGLRYKVYPVDPKVTEGHQMTKYTIIGQAESETLIWSKKKSILIPPCRLDEIRPMFYS